MLVYMYVIHVYHYMYITRRGKGAGGMCPLRFLPRFLHLCSEVFICASWGEGDGGYVSLVFLPPVPPPVL